MDDELKIFQGLQVKPYFKVGMDHAEYRSVMMAYEVMEDTPVAFGITKANPHFGEGGLPQIFLPEFNTLLESGRIRKLPEKVINLENANLSLDAYLDIMDQISNEN